jgi:hypothetical protein
MRKRYTICARLCGYHVAIFLPFRRHHSRQPAASRRSILELAKSAMAPDQGAFQQVPATRSKHRQQASERAVNRRVVRLRSRIDLRASGGEISP